MEGHTIIKLYGTVTAQQQLLLRLLHLLKAGQPRGRSLPIRMYCMDVRMWAGDWRVAGITYTVSTISAAVCFSSWSWGLTSVVCVRRCMCIQLGGMFFTCMFIYLTTFSKIPQPTTPTLITDAATSWTRWASRGFSVRGTRMRWWRRWLSPWHATAWGPSVWATVTSSVILSPTGKMRTASSMTSQPSVLLGSRTLSGQR